MQTPSFKLFGRKLAVNIVFVISFFFFYTKSVV